MFTSESCRGDAGRGVPGDGEPDFAREDYAGISHSTAVEKKHFALFDVRTSKMCYEKLMEVKFG